MNPSCEGRAQTHFPVSEHLGQVRFGVIDQVVLRDAEFLDRVGDRLGGIVGCIDNHLEPGIGIVRFRYLNGAPRRVISRG